MKKRVLAIAAALICAFALTSCDGDTSQLEQLIEQNDLVGHMTLTVSNVNGAQPYINGDTVRFKSAVANVKLDTIYLENGTISNINMGILMVGTRDNVVTADELQPPYLGVNLRDTNLGVHNISCPIDNLQFYRYLSETEVETLILGGIVFNGVGHLFAIATDEEHYYIGHSGTVTVTDFEAEPGLIKAAVSVDAIYVSKVQLEAIANGQMSSTDLPTAHFTGEISGRRANISVIVSALDIQEGE
ncbi:MAG: hypothetical protein J6Y52_01615 [Bacteroidales bacterium]|nr:hypothetical protein [Bacteroidales bacterium]